MRVNMKSRKWCSQFAWWAFLVAATALGLALLSGAAQAAEVRVLCDQDQPDLAREAPLQAEQAAPRSPLDPLELLRSFRTVYIHSDTVYMKSRVMRKAFERRPEFAAWNLSSLDSPEAADVVVEITRPLFTFNWKYRMVHQRTGVLLGAGKVTAWEGKKAAAQLAAELAKNIQLARALPEMAEEKAPGPAVAAVSGKRWKVKFESGPGVSLRPGTELRLGVEGERIIGQRKKKVVFSIPVADVVALAYNTSLKNPADKWYGFWEGFPGDEAGEDPEAMVGSLVVVLAVVGIGEILEQTKKPRQFVSIYWQDSGTIRHVALRAGSRTYIPLLAELQNATGKPWQSLPEVIASVQLDLKREKDKSIPLELDRKVNVGWRELPPGVYRVLLLERAPDYAELYFFANEDVNLEEALAQSVVEVERHPGELGELPGGAEVTYKEENGIFTLSEIRTAEIILRFTAVPLAPETEPPTGQ